MSSVRSYLVFSKIPFGALTFYFFSPFFYYLSATSLYSIDLPIYFSVADLDRMSRMFSLVLSPKFYRGRTSIVISLFGIHFPILLPISRSVILLLPSLIPLPYLCSFRTFSTRRCSISGSASGIGRIRRIFVQFRIVGLHGSK